MRGQQRRPRPSGEADLSPSVDTDKGSFPDNSLVTEQLAQTPVTEQESLGLLSGYDGGPPGRCDLPARIVDPNTAPPTRLSNRRFTGDSQLEPVVAGVATLSRGANGTGVRKIQAALEDLGYPLPEYHADAGYGSETITALTAFQRAEGLVGITPGVLDALTLGRLDQRTPQAAATLYAWREQETDTDGPDQRPTALTNGRFTGDPMLQMVMAGYGALRPGTKGPYIWKIQAALRDLGFDVGSHGADGDYGSGTAAAVKAFQDAYNVPSEPASGTATLTDAATERGTVNGVTMALLDAYAPAQAPADSPAAELSQGHAPDYAALFGDGDFEVTLAIGYDDNSMAHRRKKDQATATLTTMMGFSMTDPRTASNSEITDAGLTPGALDREILYFTKTIHSVTTGAPVDVTVKLLAAEHNGRDGARRRDLFREALEEDDAVLYTGHARAGTGPDFDAHASSAGNYVMGDGYNAHYNEEIDGAENQLAQTDFDERYQIYQLWGCTTENYWQHVQPRLQERGEDGQRLESHKDIVTTNASIPTARGLFGTLAFLHGLLSEVNSQTLSDMTDTAMRQDVTISHGMN